MKIVLIDDEELALEVTEIMLNKIGGVEVVGKYTDPHEAFQQLETLQVDVIFLDMEMGEVHGLELAEHLMSKYSHLEILFVTAHPQYALEAFEVNAVDYLLKPMNMERLKKAITKTKEKLELYHARKNDVMDSRKTFYAHTIGSFRLQDTEQNVVKWRTRKVKELFVFLWHHRETPIHKATLMETLWPDMDRNKSLTLLHTTVYQLRKTLKESGMENPINLVNENYKLSVALRSDVQVLEALIKSQKMEQESVEKVLELYKGEYLADEDYRWTISSQQYIKQSVLHYLEQYIATDKPVLVEKCLQKMLELDMYNENYMLQLLEYYGQTNNLLKMTNIYQMIVKVLRKDLGVNIPNAVEELYRKYIK